MQWIPAPKYKTYTANNTSNLPGTFRCDQTDPNCLAGDDHARAAHQYALGTYNLYANQYGRDSIDGSGMIIISTVRYCDPDLPCPLDNAYWTGDQMVYGGAMAYPKADDVVGHELTHGVTQYESNLFYYYQSGAINESFSAVWGEYFDQTNAQGNDTAGVKWQIGEDTEALRLERKAATEARGLRLTPLAFLLRAAAIALANMPRFNASLCPDGERLALKRYCHLGFATDTPHGLVVPVLRDAGRKDVFELAHELGALSAAARAGRLAPAQRAGSTFTVSCLGGVGGTHFTPIVNPPEVAILGAGRAQRLPRIVGERVEPRLILPLSLSYDHRVIDGVAGVRFTERIRELHEDPAALLAAVP